MIRNAKFRIPAAPATTEAKALYFRVVLNAAYSHRITLLAKVNFSGNVDAEMLPFATPSKYQK